MDRLGWTAGYRFRAFGVDFGVRSNDPRALEASRRILAPDWRVREAGPCDSLYSLYLGPPGSAGMRHYHLLYEDEVRRERTLDPEQLLESFRQALPYSVARRAWGKLFVQGCVVGWQGRALVLPGEHPPGSALVQALERAGARVYSERFAVLDRRGRIHPYRTPGQPKGRFGPLPLGGVLFTGYRAGARFAPRRLRPGVAALELGRQLLPIYHWPTEVLPFLPGLARTVPAWKTPHPEPATVAERILELAF